jgi:sugar lactone lactonase YvrE
LLANLVLAAHLLSDPAHAQSESNAADSATTARRLFREASTAVRAGDPIASHRHMVAATQVWPTQAAYLWQRARLALTIGDSSDAVASLRLYAALGLTHSVSGDPVFSRLEGQARFSSVLATLRTNAAPIVSSSVRAVLPDSTLWPEGIAYEPRSREFFVGSVRHRTIYAVGPKGTRALWTDVRATVGSILGVFADPDGAHLWATTAGLPQMREYSLADSTIAALLKIRIADGAIVARYDLPASSAGHTLGDVTMGPTGDVFVSDSREPVLYRLGSGARELERFTDPLFRSLQGIAPSPDGVHVYLADYSHGLLRLDLRTRTVRRLVDAPSSTSLGVDGLVWYDGGLIGVQNGAEPARVVRFRLDASGSRIVRQEVIDRNTEIADEPTIGVVVGTTYVYVANSQWNKYDDSGARVNGTRLTAALLLTLPLTR